MSLVINERTKALWMKAQSRPEWAATKFWEYVLKDQFFQGSDWSISSQQPPTDDPANLRRVDLQIDRCKNGKWNTIFIFEAKKQNCTQRDIDELEGQAYNACIDHLNYTKRKQMYAMTTIGTAARLWLASSTKDYLLPFVPKGLSLSNRDDYVEAHSSDANDLRKGFESIIRNDEIPVQQIAVLRSNAPPSRVLDSNVAESGPSSRPGEMSMAQFEYRYQPQTSMKIDYSSTANTNLQTYTASYSDLSEIPQALEPMDIEQTPDTSPSQLLDANYVEVTLRERGRTIEENLYRFNTVRGPVEKRGKDWRVQSHVHDGKIESCMVYTGQKTGISYWTWTLDPRLVTEDLKSKGKGKKQG